MKKVTLALLLSSVALAQEERVVLPQVADGGGWKTRIGLVNRSLSIQARAILNFYGQDGRPLAFAIDGAGVVSTIERTIPPGGSVLLETGGTQPAVQAGWMEVRSGVEIDAPGGGGGGYVPPSILPPFASAPAVATSTVSAFVAFRQRIASRPDFETSVFSVPEQTRAVAFALDNQENYVTSIAVANTQTTPTDVTVTFRAPNGTVVHREALALAARGHSFFETTNRFQASRNQRGTVEFVSATGRLAALCLWFNPSGPFASVPSLTLAQ